jgi:hypothetical protein
MVPFSSLKFQNQKTAGSNLLGKKKSESENSWVSVIFGNIKELAVFVKEWGKEPAGRKGSIFRVLQKKT